MSRPGFCKGGGKPEILAARGGGLVSPPPPLHTYGEEFSRAARNLDKNLLDIMLAKQFLLRIEIHIIIAIYVIILSQTLPTCSLKSFLCFALK